jgi:hypothetical protein
MNFAAATTKSNLVALLRSRSLLMRLTIGDRAPKLEFDQPATPNHY